MSYGPATEKIYACSLSLSEIDVRILAASHAIKIYENRRAIAIKHKKRRSHLDHKISKEKEKLLFLGEVKKRLIAERNQPLGKKILRFMLRFVGR